MEQALEVTEHEAGEGGQESPFDLVHNEIFRIQSLGAAFLALAEKEDLPGRFDHIVSMMLEQVDMIEDKLEAWEPAP